MTGREHPDARSSSVNSCAAREKPMAKIASWLSPRVRLSQEVDRLFDELIYRPWGCSHTGEAEWQPQLDLYETDTAFILEADLPGVEEKEVSVAVEDRE